MAPTDLPASSSATWESLIAGRPASPMSVGFLQEALQAAQCVPAFAAGTTMAAFCGQDRAEESRAPRTLNVPLACHDLPQGRMALLWAPTPPVSAAGQEPCCHARPFCLPLLRCSPILIRPALRLQLWRMCQRFSPEVGSRLRPFDNRPCGGNSRAASALPVLHCWAAMSDQSRPSTGGCHAQAHTVLRVHPSSSLQEQRLRGQDPVPRRGSNSWRKKGRLSSFACSSHDRCAHNRCTSGWLSACCYGRRPCRGLAPARGHCARSADVLQRSHGPRSCTCVLRIADLPDQRRSQSSSCDSAQSRVWQDGIAVGWHDSISTLPYVRLGFASTECRHIHSLHMFCSATIPLLGRPTAHALSSLPAQRYTAAVPLSPACLLQICRRFHLRFDCSLAQGRQPASLWIVSSCKELSPVSLLSLFLFGCATTDCGFCGFSCMMHTRVTQPDCRGRQAAGSRGATLFVVLDCLTWPCPSYAAAALCRASLSSAVPTAVDSSGSDCLGCGLCLFGANGSSSGLPPRPVLADLRSKESSQLRALVLDTQPAIGCSNLLLSVLPWFASFCRSFFLLQLLACLRMLLFAMPLCRQAPTVNGRIRRVRSLVRGAPFCVLVALAFSGAFAMQSGRPVLMSGDSPAQSTHIRSPAAHQDSTHLPARGGSYRRGSPRAAAAVPSQARDPSSPLFSRQRELGWEVPVMILRFQRSCSFVTLHTAAVADADDLSEQVEDGWEALQLGHVCIPAYPQPSLDVLVLVTAPTRFHLLHRVPVCVQMHDSHEVTTCWQEYFDETICLADVQFAMGSQWIEGSRAFLRDHTVPLGARSVPVRAGDLLRIVRPGLSLPAVASVAVKLARPDLHLRSLQVEGFPDTPPAPSRDCLLQPLCPTSLVMYSPVPGPSLLSEVLLSHADHSLWEPRLVWPLRPLEDLWIAGLAVNRTGTFPAHNTRRIPVFVDTREVGFPAQLRASYSGTMPLHVFVESVGLLLPDLEFLEVDGTAAFSVQARAITVQEGDVVVLTYSTRSGHERPFALGSSPPPLPDLSLDGTDDADCGGRPGAGLASETPGARDRRPRRPKHMPGSRRCQLGKRLSVGPATPLSPRFDAVDEALRRMRFFDLRQQLRRTELATEPLVFEDGPVPPPVFGQPAPVEPEPPQDESSDGSVPAEDGSAHSYLPALLSIRVAVATLQGPTRLHSLWTQEGEDIDSFLVRASIIINDDADFTALLPVDPQPPGPQLTLLLCPKWWKLAGIRPVLIQGGQIADDLVPHDALLQEAPSEASAPSTTHRPQVGLTPECVPASVLEDAALLCLQTAVGPGLILQSPP